jgi:hypothetical protein
MVWIYPGSPLRKEFRRMSSIEKLMLTVFWDHRGPLGLDFMPRGATIDAENYCGALALLRAVIREKRPGDLVDNAVPLHDNARPHVANRTAARLQSFGWEIVEHALCSPNLASVTSVVFGPLQKLLAGQSFIFR